jgi:hypothetical protein
MSIVELTSTGTMLFTLTDVSGAVHGISNNIIHSSFLEEVGFVDTRFLMTFHFFMH